jgi:hypothetical protein
MNWNTMTDEQRLQSITRDISFLVSGGGRGYVTAHEHQLLKRLEAQLGKQWDAINAVWRPLETD